MALSGRNRRRTPPAVAELRGRVRELVRGLMLVDVDYRWLHASGYAKPHATAGQIGDPADLLTGEAAAARHGLIRAAEAVDDAFDAVGTAIFELEKVLQ